MAKKDRQQNKQQMRNVPNVEATNRFDMSFIFLGVLFFVMLLSFRLGYKITMIKQVAPDAFEQTFSILPSLQDVVQNIKLSFQGYTGGYYRSVIGYILFLLMSFSFIYVGRMIFPSLVDKSLR